MIAAVADSLAYLKSDAARASIAADPYWPKWHSPWWHVLALREAGAAAPPDAVRALVEASAGHYLTLFPKSAAELPPGKTLRSHVMCFCALGSLLSAAEGIATIPWADDFIARYQGADGGWNCDEEGRGSSSVVSTVPVLEYLLGRPLLSPGQRVQLERGMQFLLSLKLFRSRRSGAVLNEAWLTPSLPRFYGYDVLRGLRLVARWVERTAAAVPREAIADALVLPTNRFGSWATSDEARTRHGVVASFPLCDALGHETPKILAAEWARVRATLG